MQDTFFPLLRLGTMAGEHNTCPQYREIAAGELDIMAFHGWMQVHKALHSDCPMF